MVSAERASALSASLPRPKSPSKGSTASVPRSACRAGKLRNPHEDFVSVPRRSHWPELGLGGEAYEMLLKQMREVMRGNVLVDLRNVYQPKLAEAAGFVYYGVGRGLLAPVEDGAQDNNTPSIKAATG